MDNIRLYIFILVPVAIFIVITILLGKKKAAFPKYIPAIIASIISIGLFIKTYFFSEGFEALGYVVLLMVTVPVSVIALVTAVVIEILNHRKLKKL